MIESLSKRKAIADQRVDTAVGILRQMQQERYQLEFQEDFETKSRKFGHVRLTYKGGEIWMDNIKSGDTITCWNTADTEQLIKNVKDNTGVIPSKETLEKILRYVEENGILFDDAMKDEVEQ